MFFIFILKRKLNLERAMIDKGALSPYVGFSMNSPVIENVEHGAYWFMPPLD